MEVYNKVIESALRRLLALFPSMYWDELLPDVKWGLRNCVCAAHGYRPFEIAFKQAPVNLHTQWTECCQVDMTIAKVN